MKSVNLAKNIAVTAIMAALLILGKLVLSMVPNVEVVTPFIIIFTCVFGFRRTILAVLTFCLLDNFLYPPSLDVTVQYFFHWPLLCMLTALLARRWNGNVWVFTAEAVVLGLLFWIETPAIMWLMYSSPFYPLLISGVAFMIPTVVSGLVSVLLLYPILFRILGRVRVRMFPDSESAKDSDSAQKICLPDNSKPL